MDVDDLANLLLMVQGDFDVGTRRDPSVALVERVKAFFFNVQLILASGESGQLAPSGESRLAMHRSLGGGLNGDAGRGDRDSIFVYDGDGGRGSGLCGGSADQGERKEESTHA